MTVHEFFVSHARWRYCLLTLSSPETSPSAFSGSDSSSSKVSFRRRACFCATLRKYTRLQNFHNSMPRKKSNAEMNTTPHSQVMPTCLKTTVLITGMYSVGKIVTKPIKIAQKRNLLRRTSYHLFVQVSKCFSKPHVSTVQTYHCVKYFLLPGCILKKLRRISTSSQAKNNANHVKHAKHVARPR